MRVLRISRGFRFPTGSGSLTIFLPLLPCFEHPFLVLQRNPLAIEMQGRWPVGYLRKFGAERFTTPEGRLGLCALAILAAFAGDVAAYAWSGLPVLLAQFLVNFDFVAVVVGGISFGPKGGLITAAIAGVSHTLVQHLGFHRPLAGQGELSLFILVGLLAGFVTERKGHSVDSKRSSGEPSVGSDKWGHIGFQARFPSLGQQITPALIHQLRTPLASIQGAGFVLEDGKLPDDKRRELVGIILKECERLDLLLGLMDSNQSGQPHDEAFDLSALLEDIAQRASDTLGGSRFTIEKQITNGLPQLHCDREAMERAILNVVMDGMKAMPEGGKIVLACGLVNDEIKIQVSDQRAELSADRLRRAINSMPIGCWPELDLAIAQHIIDRHGGSMRIEQNADRGITFSLILPRVSGAHA